MTARPEPNVDALEAEAIGALEKLRSAGRTSDILKVWCDDARDAVSELVALARANTARDQLLQDAMDELRRYSGDTNRALLARFRALDVLAASTGPEGETE